jgi:predicted transposase YdaD
MAWYALAVPGPFDNTTRYLVQAYPADWLAFLGFDPAGLVEVIDANLSTVAAEVDKVMLVRGPSPWLVHLEFQSSYDSTIGERLVRYNAMLHLRDRLPVASVLVLLRPQAEGAASNGIYRVALPGRQPYLTFSYAVRRIWHEPSTDLLIGPLGTLPLAPLGEVEPTVLPALLRTMDQRFAAEASTAEADRLRIVTYTLLGLRYSSDLADQLMPGIGNMRDSSTYMAIVEEGLVRGRAEGRADEARTLLVYLGTRRFGPPDTQTRGVLDAVQDPDRLDGWCRRLLDVSTWDELLATL